MTSVSVEGAPSRAEDPTAAWDGEAVASRVAEVRGRTERIAARLTPEDQLLQSMPATSPTKWHRAHTTWFWERFVLRPLGIAPVDERSDYLWNSYYEAVGARHPRVQRGLLSRPGVAEVGAWRREVDARLGDAIRAVTPEQAAAIRPVVELGMAHEEQHQELMLTDILHAFAQNPLRPAYRQPSAPAARPDPGSGWRMIDGGLVTIGTSASSFAFDNEGPAHRVFLAPYALAARFVSVAEVDAFRREGGYRTPSLWLSDGWDWVQREGIQAPMYWQPDADRPEVFSLQGMRRPLPEEPASHLSFYEADAIARFLGGRLPTEQEWEHAAASEEPAGQFLELEGPLVPAPVSPSLFGSVWTWTQSAYAPWPGYRPTEGALGEYNGKFMVNQIVLRGGSCLTPPGHVRATYRNFWPPETRFQMSGLRLARDAGRAVSW
jgi:ergothioneine biosynthesis protein EgtB